jgi:osmotically-inducible protein OsmY
MIHSEHKKEELTRQEAAHASPMYVMSRDGEITEAVLRAIRLNAALPDSITVAVRDGWVTLGGKADWRFERKEVERAVRTIPGVEGVTNEINVLLRPLIPRAHGRSEARPLP